MKPKFFAIGLCILIAGCKSKESVLLKLKYSKQEEQAFAITIRLHCSSSSYIDLETHAHLSLDSTVNNSLYFLTAKVDAIKNDIEFGGVFPLTRSVHYDSQKSYAEMSNDERDMDDQFDAIKSNYYHITLDNSGGAVRPFTVAGKTVEPPFGINLVQLPFLGRKVKVGDTWTRRVYNPLKTTVGRLLSSNYTFTFTVDDIKANQVLIDVEMKVQSKLPYKNEMTGYDAKGVYTIDRNTGQTISGYIKMPAGECGEALISVVKEDPGP